MGKACHRSGPRATAGPFTVEKTTKVNRLACVQDHHMIDTVGKNRYEAIVPELVVEGTWEEFRTKPALGTRKVLSLSMR